MPTSPAMRRIRRWHQRILWWESEAAGRRLWHVRRMAKTPLRAAREAIVATRRYGGTLRDEEGLSFAAQAAWQWLLRMRYGLPAEAYYRFGLHRPEARRQAGEWISEEESIALLAHLDRLIAREDLAIVSDKRRFVARCLEHGLPVVELLAWAEKGELHLGTSAKSGSLPRRDLFSKPADLWGGQGGLAWTCTGPGRWRSSDRRDFDEAGLLSWLRQMSMERPYVLQERLENHPALAPLSKGGLCTVRLVTMRLPEGGIAPLGGVLKMPSGESVVDNIDLGGLAAGIDAETGRAGGAIQLHDRVLVRRFLAHPDTSARIEGCEVPFWPEIKDLALRAHGLFPNLVFCGFDIAASHQGPVLLEGNDMPGLEPLQIPQDRPIGHTRFAEVYDAHMRRARCG